MSVLGSGNDFHSNYKVVSLKLLNDVEYEKAKISCNKLHKSFFNDYNHCFNTLEQSKSYLWSLTRYTLTELTS